MSAPDQWFALALCAFIASWVVAGAGLEFSGVNPLPMTSLDVKDVSSMDCCSCEDDGNLGPFWMLLGLLTADDDCPASRFA